MKKISNNKYKVTFLVDNKNTWFSKYLNIFPIKNKKYIFKVSSNVKKVFNQDVLFIINYTKILNKKRLLQNKLNLVIHSSNLPKNRGGAPLHWQILRNKKKIKICLFEAIEKLDAGNIFLTEELSFNGTELYDELRDKQAKKMIKLIKKFLSKYPKIKGTSQFGKPSFNEKRNSNHSELDINKSIKDQFNLMRISDNEKYPAFFNFRNNKYILKIYKK
ncbi:formyltransferase family protein [Candidatus Pelagibacter sp.]|jgi:methionyl-tRNA formyltransferase|nr:formyltransferase family protein [Candidatus Pelagibacter sp.]|tara:strand:+ start:198 stop:851 length:654 start_codon:yes stop_codon:yes gene_type:complete